MPLVLPGRAYPPGSALGRGRPVRPVTALISPVVPFRATSFYYPPRQISAHVDEKTDDGLRGVTSRRQGNGGPAAGGAGIGEPGI
jgi:hypothetical protein